MSQHPRLRSTQKEKKHRTVLKRYERVRELKEKEKWQEGDSIFGLLKLKILKFKLKKEKAAPLAEGAEALPAEGAGAPASEAQAQKGAPKAEPAKKEEKKK